ncbi:MAG: N,N'-diacetylchitobiose phosphorylase [Blautia sp.]|nr:N,N'-diacetylchitobiose phosphorylase [Blautia sp.]
MQYGFFDDKNREYVITRPDTPEAWANYLGSPEYGALISNNAGGYSFVKSGANGRILRYSFDRSDKPGRYIYLRDNETCDYWSASWQPVGKEIESEENVPGNIVESQQSQDGSGSPEASEQPLNSFGSSKVSEQPMAGSGDVSSISRTPESTSKYTSECRHGLGYTVISSSYSGIGARTLYYVPQGADWEVWNIEVTNQSDKERQLTVTGYAEFTNNSNYEQDQVNLQYSRFVTSTVFRENRVLQRIHGNLASSGDDSSVDNNDFQERFFGLARGSVDSWCGDKALFLGNYHSYGDPVGVISGNLGDEAGYNDYCCGAISSVITLAPGEKKQLTFVLGMKHDAEAASIMEHYENSDACREELASLKECWEERLSGFRIKTPCPEFDTMINIWNAYNCFMTFIWSRAASFIYCGLRNGYGYRDTVQDIQGIIHLQPEMAAEKIRFMLSGQVDNGAGLPLVKFTHNPGHEDTPDDASYVKETGHPAYRADDALWLFPTVFKYVAETGNTDFLNEIIPYANKGEDTVYDHLKKAIGFSLAHLGPHGMPAGLHADWNDCLRLGKNGESTFVAFQFCYAFKIMKLFAEKLNDTDYIPFLDEQLARQEKLLNTLCWDNDRYIRGFTEAGQVIGKREDNEASMWLNPQSWAVISRTASPSQAESAMDSVMEHLNTPYGAILMDPPYQKEAFDGALMVIYNKGVKENSGVFSQSQGWLVLAEALLGHGDRAFTYWKENSPSMQNNKAEIRRMEPYCYGQFTEGKDSPHMGRSHVHWLTGTASTMMVGCVEGILGMRPDIDGLRLSPSIPAEWEGLTIDKIFRGKKLHIEIKNPAHKQSGCHSLLLNGKEIGCDYIPAAMLDDTNTIILTL